MKYQAIQSLRKLSVVMLISGLSLALMACTEEPPLKIGFIGGLTGRHADLGVTGRDAVILAVEEQNQTGGIAGRKVELIIKDDRQDDASARQAIDDLVGEQVVAIIGPMTSSVAMLIKPLIDSAEVVTISPTVTTDQLSGLDDFFLRVTAPLSGDAQRLADHAVKSRQQQKFAVVYDLSNRAFTENWLTYFTKALETNGGQIVFTEGFTSQPDVHFLPIAERLLAAEPEAVLLLSNAIDTALLSQQIRKLSSPVVLYSASWAFTTDLISFGGRAVDGMMSFNGFNASSQRPRYLTFKERFTRRFGYAPSFATVFAYDAATCLFAGLASNPGRVGLKQALLSQGLFPGLQSDRTLDPYGDIETELFLTVVEDGQFKVVE